MKTFITATTGQVSGLSFRPKTKCIRPIFFKQTGFDLPPTPKYQDLDLPGANHENAISFACVDPIYACSGCRHRPNIMQYVCNKYHWKSI